MASSVGQGVSEQSRMAGVNMEFEIEVRTLQEAKEKVTALRSTFGEDVFVKINWVAGDKSKLLTTINEGTRSFFEELREQMRKKEEEKK